MDLAEDPLEPVHDPSADRTRCEADDTANVLSELSEGKCLALAPFRRSALV
jgi:hypothetical protein